MKLPKPVARELVWDALFKADGDRVKTCEALGVTPRTLARYITDLDLHGDMEALGWKKTQGPPTGPKKGSSVVHERILAAVRRSTGGHLNYAKLAVDLYGSDTPAVRNRVYLALETLRNEGKLKFDGETWALTAA